MKKMTLLLSLTLLGFTALVGAESLNSLRAFSLEEQEGAEKLKDFPKDNPNVDLSYIHQPPLIPHSIRGYQINKNSNKCLSCHSFKNFKESGATKISISHFTSRDDQVLSDVSPRRYFCLQCHVPQVNAKPLVGNTFKPVGGLSE